MSSENDSSVQKAKPNSNPKGIPVVFTDLVKVSDRTERADKDAGAGSKRPRPAKGQKEIVLKMALDEKHDPMVMTVSGEGLVEQSEKLNISINDDDVTVMINEKELFGYEKMHLPEKVIPQFTVAFFEKDMLKLFLKKEFVEGYPDDSKPPSMVWCSENVFEEIEALKAKADENLERFHQAQLELQNQIVRGKRDRQNFEDKFASQLLLSVLEVQDNFDRALAASKSSRGKRSLVEGVAMIRKQLDSVLSCNGVSEIEAQGKPFDPMLHEALAVEETSEVSDNTVLEVIQKGYRYNNKVLRLAKVKVSVQKSDEK